MIDVACFCGCSYSFVGDGGVCPSCGESVSFPRVSAPEDGAIDSLEDRPELTFEIEAALHLANEQYVVRRTAHSIERAPRAIRRRLDSAADTPRT